MIHLRSAAVGLPLAAAALWALSVTTTGAPAAPGERQAVRQTAPEAEPPAPLWFDLASQRARLEELTTATDDVPARNPFRFAVAPAGRALASPARRLPVDSSPVAAGPPEPAEPPMTVRLIGVAATSSPDGPRRSAILSGLGQVFIVGAGDLVAGRYRVVGVGEDAIELQDEAAGRSLRLGLR